MLQRSTHHYTTRHRSNRGARQQIDTPQQSSKLPPYRISNWGFDTKFVNNLFCTLRGRYTLGNTTQCLRDDVQRLPLTQPIADGVVTTVGRTTRQEKVPNAGQA